MQNQDGIRYWSARTADADEIHFVACDSPISLAALETMRRPLRDGNLETAPTLKIVWGQGEPASPFATKINGRVYRPKSRPWPLDEDGRPMAFFMQFGFDEASDFLGELPGEVLQIYAPAVRPIWGGPPRIVWGPDDANCGFIFEWIRSDDSDLVPHEDASQGAGFPICYGVGARTHDYVDFDGIIELLEPVYRENLPEHPFHCREFLGSAARVCGTKIGGLPVWFNEPPRSDVEGRLLCTFRGISLAWEQEYPWANHQKPISLQDSISDDNMLLFGDGRLMQVFLNSHGELQCETEDI